MELARWGAQGGGEQGQEKDGTEPMGQGGRDKGLDDPIGIPLDCGHDRGAAADQLQCLAGWVLHLVAFADHQGSGCDL